MASVSPPSSGGDAPGGSEAPSGPVLALLARGLEIWLRRQCEAIETLEIQLQGSAAQLMVGRLEGVRLSARRVVYRDLRLESVELRSGPIRVRRSSLLPGRDLNLDEPFEVAGTVAFRGEDLGRSLACPAWRDLGDGLAQDLLGISPLAGLRIDEQQLVLQALPSGSEEPVEIAAEVRAEGGSLELRSLEGGALSRLPMDPAIQIHTAGLRGGLLELEGEARVST
jgi:hypothetical protein